LAFFLPPLTASPLSNSFDDSIDRSGPDPLLSSNELDTFRDHPQNPRSSATNYMARPSSEHPTELELEILKVLWQESPLPVREVRRRLEEEAGRTLAHSSVITMLNIMVRKGYLRRKRNGKAFHFAPRVAKDRVHGGMLRDVVTRLFDGSASAMVLSLLETTDLDDEEMKELRRMVNRKTS
jgi:predicted transcriptional regulator